MNRVDYESAGAIVVRNVKVGAGRPGTPVSFLHITGVERGPGGFAVLAFRYIDEMSAAAVGEGLFPATHFSREHPNFLGEIQVYATSSPVVPPHERLTPLGTSEPLPLTSYETFIDVEGNADVMRGAADCVDLLLLLLTSDGVPVPSHRFQFTGLTAQSTPSTA